MKSAVVTLETQQAQKFGARLPKMQGRRGLELAVEHAYVLNLLETQNFRGGIG
jgi:hypothetical protein